MAEAATSVLPTSAYTRGALYGLAAVSIWAGNTVVAGIGLRSSLTPWDISAIRFATAGLLLLPYLLRQGLAFERLGWIGLAALVLGGAPTVLLATCGLQFAPASHAGALFAGVMPLMVAILAAAVLKEVLTPQQRAGFALIVTGVVGIVWGTGGTVGATQNIGHLLFLGAALAWACYTVAMRRARLDGLHAAAISAVGVAAALPAPICLRGRGEPVRGLAKRHSPSGARAGAPDRGHFVCPLRAGDRHSRCFERSCFRCTMSGDDGSLGHPDPRRVAVGDRLDGYHFDLGRRLCRQRRAVARAAGVTG